MRSLGKLTLVMGFRQRKDVWELPSLLLGKMGKGT